MTHAVGHFPQNPDHHLWRNGRYWWIAFTLLYHGWRQERVRRSLRTADLEEARRRRDAILEHFACSSDPVLSLRLVPVRQDADSRAA
ncbi:MAG: hypothetical protein EHM24_12945 [Acidobacteria bacterium]|nr:MAG: hypothetical protein EHM24_12945 [Acidobacteriota bacterium]